MKFHRFAWNLILNFTGEKPFVCATTAQFLQKAIGLHSGSNIYCIQKGPNITQLKLTQERMFIGIPIFSARQSSGRHVLSKPAACSFLIKQNSASVHSVTIIPNIFHSQIKTIRRCTKTTTENHNETSMPAEIDPKPWVFPCSFSSCFFVPSVPLGFGTSLSNS